mmetsp:Transcript_23068/g.17491  ORF Transcript_23068/g.17491 Transcript_23068/m.17491 type:complete len:93 (-) Transcript_23068:266-544(-)|eukprot:CAMPEP_0202961992 /NCGR_PEP_ID=MMETSP1396-20130829/6093_1 /ASSEMBLY_ACC=CAM_ASM_000872 /TAXON_ID= /ORGANISM="Pseudokeronopsis sp., Strain Brazil" /LENGTH=92 /DNA_ID=CAMNT_0049682257 /DNA_START=60 /DNA_END=338 /DNA_ORIENTATION=+
MGNGAGTMSTEVFTAAKAEYEARKNELSDQDLFNHMKNFVDNYGSAPAEEHHEAAPAHAEEHHEAPAEAHHAEEAPAEAHHEEAAPAEGEAH